MLKSIPKLERLYKLSVNVILWDKQPYVVYVSENTFKSDKINLLLYKNHFMLITNLNALFGSTKYNCVRVCDKCFMMYKDRSSFDSHKIKCSLGKYQKYSVPPRGTKIIFKNFSHQIKNNFVIYADFEALLADNDEVKGKSSKLIQKHVVTSFAGLRICSVNKKFNSKIVHGHGENVMESFFKFLEDMSIEIDSIVENEYFPIKLSSQDIDRINKATKCEFCGKSFSCFTKKYRDHCHLTDPNRVSSNFRYVLCNICNLNLASIKTQNRIPVLFHNLNGYDSHFIISAFTENKYNLGKLSILPKNKQRSITFSIGRFCFIDSFNLLPSSLSTLVENLVNKDKLLFKNLIAYYPTNYELFLKKQHYPYSYCKKLEDYDDFGLPPQSAFDDALNNKKISNDDYKHVEKVYKLLNCQSFKDYTLFYLFSDVLLLADVFEAHRNLCFEIYGLDCTYYISHPQFSFDAFLKTSKIQNLEPLPSIEIYDFVTKAKRGGVSVINKKISKANNKYMKLYNRNEEDIFILGVDANNLYGYAMTKPLAFSGYEWITGSFQYLKSLLTETPEDSLIGYLAEVDLLYPMNIHSETNDFPLAPEKLTIRKDMFSPKTKKLFEKNYNNRSYKCEKLTLNLLDKYNYVTYYENLKYYLKRGMILSKIHKVLKFNQSKWLKDFVVNNNQKRIESLSKCDNLFWKLSTNAVYGKLLESQKDRFDFNIYKSRKKFDMAVRSQNFKDYVVFNENMVGVETFKENIVLSKPTLAGVMVLEHAKLFMYKYHELFTKELYERKNIELLFSDTDSFLFEIKTIDVYKDLEKIRCFLDTSNYPHSHSLYSLENKSKLGCFKDEYPGDNLPIEFIGLKTKMYSILSLNQSEKKTAKGLQSSTINLLSHAIYSKCLRDELKINSIVYSIRSFNHALYTVRQVKSSINSFDDKRYYLIDGIKSLAYGHYKILWTK